MQVTQWILELVDRITSPLHAATDAAEEATRVIDDTEEVVERLGETSGKTAGKLEGLGKGMFFLNQQISPSSNNSYTIMNKGELYQIELQGEMEKIHNARTAAESVGRQVVQAPMPGVILKTYVKKGDLVKRGDPLCVLVAMKMENEIRSVTDGVVKEVFVEDGMKVGLNDRIMVIE